MTASETSWPYVSQATTDSQYSWLFRELGDGVVRTGATGLRGTANSSGMVTFLDAGRALLRGYMYRNTATFSLTHDASGAQPRIDLVVLELDISAVAYADRVLAKVIKGTPGSSPVEPTLTQTDTGIWQFPLYSVLIGASVANISAGNVSDRRVWTKSHLAPWTTTTRPANPRAYYDLGYNTTTSRWEVYNGSTWVEFNAGAVNGRHFFDSVSDPAPGDGVNGDVWYVTEA